MSAEEPSEADRELASKIADEFDATVYRPYPNGPVGGYVGRHDHATPEIAVLLAAHCAAREASLRAEFAQELKRRDEIAEAFLIHEKLEQPPAEKRILQMIQEVCKRACICSTTHHAIRVMCEEYAASESEVAGLRAALEGVMPMVRAYKSAGSQDDFSRDYRVIAAAEAALRPAHAQTKDT